MDMNWASVTIEINDGKMEWIATDVEDKSYNGYWQTADSLLTEEEMNQILAILIRHTSDLYTDEDRGDEEANCGWMKWQAADE